MHVAVVCLFICLLLLGPIGSPPVQKAPQTLATQASPSPVAAQFIQSKRGCRDASFPGRRGYSPVMERWLQSRPSWPGGGQVDRSIDRPTDEIDVQTQPMINHDAAACQRTILDQSDSPTFSRFGQRGLAPTSPCVAPSIIGAISERVYWVTHGKPPLIA